ncbi:MAG: GAF domain-containing protein, partial [Chloroflexi bacterium]|nr:GAF domain-containing protein [Chloroflexota bacterium]
SGDALSNYHQLRSTLIAPLVVEERVLGTLELGSVIANTYADETLQRLIGAVVHVLATAIESVQAGGSAEMQNRQRQALQVVTSALTSKMELSTILDQIVGGIARALNVASAIFMIDRRGRKMRLEAQSGLDQEVLDRFFSRELSISDKSIVGETILRRQPHVSHDIATDERFPESRMFFTESGMHSIFSHPLVTGTTVYGALLLLSPEPGGFTPLKTDILSLFASQATVAIHNGMLLEAAQQRSHFQEAIERLERMHERHAAELSNGSGEGAMSEAPAQQDELELLEYVRKETQHTFGVSFTSLLRFISDHLLTQNERDLQAVLYAGQSGAVLEAIERPRVDSTALFTVKAAEQAATHAAQSEERKNSFADTLSLLSQTAESALVRAGMVGELSRLIFQLKQSANWVNNPWFVVDLDGLCRYMNPPAEALCGTRLAGMTPYNTQPFVTAFPSDASVPVEEVFEKMLPRIRNRDEVVMYLQDFKQGTAHRRELRWVLAIEPARVRSGLQQVVAKGEDSLPLESASSDHHYQFIRYPMYNPQGQLEAYALQVHDVTEQVRDEQNRSALFSSVSHDLRTPLTTIKAAVTGLLQKDVAWSEQDRQAMLEDIDSETDHLTVLVTALVEMSRIEMGALILEKEWCDIAEVMYGALAKLQRVVAGHPICVHSPRQLPLVYIDHVQMERVFYNLIENAARHSPERGEILIALDVVNDGTEMLRVQVIDHGSGVPEHERERIFNSFYSLRSYSNGLGLAICKGIIDAHQGRIWADAAVDGGSCFVFTLPTHPYSMVPGGGEATSSTKGALLNDEVAGE